MGVLDWDLPAAIAAKQAHREREDEDVDHQHLLAELVSRIYDPALDDRKLW